MISHMYTSMFYLLMCGPHSMVIEEILAENQNTPFIYHFFFFGEEEYSIVYEFPAVTS